MDDYDYELIHNKYDNLVFPELPDLLASYLDQHKNYRDLIIQDYFGIADIMYFLRNKPVKDNIDLLEWVLSYIEARFGIFERLKQRAEACCNNT